MGAGTRQNSQPNAMLGLEKKMNKNFKTFVASVALIGVAALPLVAHADDRKPVNERQGRQQERIRNGRDSGTLTPREAADLKRREAQIRADEARDRRSGGKFTDKERDGIQDRLDRLSGDIGKQKDDRQNVRPRYDRPGSYQSGYSRPGYYRPGINDRQRYQQNQITRGRRAGVLTPSEASALRAREARVRYLETRLRDSGNRLTPTERYRLQSELSGLRRDIYRQSTDAQYRR